jgi:hypothetical protein
MLIVSYLQLLDPWQIVKQLITSMFNSVPHVKMERFAGCVTYRQYSPYRACITIWLLNVWKEFPENYLII